MGTGRGVSGGPRITRDRRGSPAPTSTLPAYPCHTSGPSALRPDSQPATLPRQQGGLYISDRGGPASGRGRRLCETRLTFRSAGGRRSAPARRQRLADRSPRPARRTRRLHRHPYPGRKTRPRDPRRGLPEASPGRGPAGKRDARSAIPVRPDASDTILSRLQALHSGCDEPQIAALRQIKEDLVAS